MRQQSILDLFEFGDNETVTIKIKTLREIEDIANDHNEVISRLKALLDIDEERSCRIDIQDLYYFINKFVTDYINGSGITALTFNKLSADDNEEVTDSKE